MTTAVKIDAHAGWPVRVTAIEKAPEGKPKIIWTQTVQPRTESTFYIHSGLDLLVHEVQPDEELPKS